MVNDVKSPCNGCEARFYDAENKQSCHSTCPRYAFYRTAHREYIRHVNRQKRPDRLYGEYKQVVRRRLHKMKKIKKD